MTRLSLDRKPSIFVFDRNRKIEVFISFKAAIKIIKILNDSDFLIKDREDLIVFFLFGKKIPQNPGRPFSRNANYRAYRKKKRTRKTRKKQKNF